MDEKPLHEAELIDTLEGLSTVELSESGLPDAPLLAIVRDPSLSLRARLNACEILLRRDPREFERIIGVGPIATIYASALNEKATVDLNPWAFLGLGETGPMGKHLVACGGDAVAALIPLLENRRWAGIYSGSAESNEGNSDLARVCDFAAFFISQIEHFPYRFHRDDLAQRDAEIEQVKQKLKETI